MRFYDTSILLLSIIYKIIKIIFAITNKKEDNLFQANKKGEIDHQPIRGRQKLAILSNTF